MVPPTATPSGPVRIAEVEVGDRVLARHETTDGTGAYPVTATFAHRDPVLVRLELGGETILTTPEHPFYTTDGWESAGELTTGDAIRRLDGSWGAVRSAREIQRPRVMHNLTVAGAHTFFVGERAWLVHNQGCKPYELVEYGTKTPGLERHHGVLDVWARANVPSYSRPRPSNSPAITLTPAQHNATRSVFAQWRIARTGSATGKIDWTKVSEREIHQLSESMFDAAGVPREIRDRYYSAFEQYAQTGTWTP